MTTMKAIKVFDTMSVLSNTTGGISPNEMFVMYGRGTGKSMLKTYINKWTNMTETRPPKISHGEMDHKVRYKYWAKVENGPWGLEREINEWCEENFGALDVPGYRNPRWTNKMKWGVWHFKHDADLTLFLLRWTM